MVGEGGALLSKGFLLDGAQGRGSDWQMRVEGSGHLRRVFGRLVLERELENDKDGDVLRLTDERRPLRLHVRRRTRHEEPQTGRDDRE